MYKVMLLDFDGTIADTLEDIYDAIVAVFDMNGLTAPDFETARELMGDGLKMFLQKSLAATGNDISATDMFVDDFIDYYSKHCTIKTTLYDDILEVLNTLRSNDIRLAVVSNKAEKFLRVILEHFGMISLFEVIVGGDTFEDKKPSALPIIKTLELMNADKSDTIMIGDSKNDVLSGINAGVSTCLCTYGYYSGMADSGLNADYTIDKPLQILDLLK